MARPIEQLSLEQQMMLMLADRLDPDAGVGTNQAIVEARSSLKKFTTYTMSEYQVNWHHDVFFEKLEAWCRGDITRLMIFCPPQMGKSELVSRRLPAYVLGRNPDEFVISCSYNNRYASRNNRDVQAIIDSDAYREVFPGTQMIGKGRNVHGSWQRNSRQFHVVGRRGGYLSAGIRSGISGEPFTCLAAGTLVQGRLGFLQIEDVKAGDMVWSYNLSSKNAELKRVVAVASSIRSDLVRIYAAGVVITATSDHPFYVPGTGYQRADSIRVGQKLLAITGEEEVNIIEKIDRPGTMVHDIQIQGNANFFANGLLAKNCGIIDDPVRDDADATSPVIQEAIFNWYCTVFSARKTKANARILIVMTRWAQADLAGRLLDAAKRDPKVDQWVVVKFPNILETEAQRTEYDHRRIGECLWPERHPQKEVEAERAILSALKWSAVHQQEPSPARGVVFRRDDFRYFHAENTPDGLVLVLQDSIDSTPRRYRATDCQFYQVCDAADTTNTASAYTAVGTFARTPDNDLCVFHFWRAKLEFPVRYKHIISLREDPPEGPPWPTQILYQAIEAKASGVAMIQQGASEGKPFRSLKPGSLGKEARATNVADLYENKKVFHRSGQPWLTDFESELLSFPSGQYLDQCDCLAYAGILYVQGTSAKGLTEELLLGREPPREADGSVSLKGTSLDLEINTFQVGRYEVEFEDDW